MEKKIKFDDNVCTYLIPLEDRKGIWMQYAIDRAHFKRRIEKAEESLAPVLRKKLIEYKLNTTNIV